MCDFGRFAQRALNLIVIAMADQHQRIALLGELDGLNMNLGDQRAGSVDHLQFPLPADLAHRRRNAVRAIDDARALGHLVDVVDKDGALFR